MTATQALSDDALCSALDVRIERIKGLLGDQRIVALIEVFRFCERSDLRDGDLQQVMEAFVSRLQ